MQEHFYTVTTTKEGIEMSNMSENEKSCIDKLKWFSHKELSNLQEITYPQELIHELLTNPDKFNFV